MDTNIDFQKCYDTIYKCNNRIIKRWCFYYNNALNVLECQIDELHPLLYKYYLNNIRVYDNSELECYINMIISTQYIINDHEHFIKEMESFIGEITYNSDTKYGWCNKKVPYSLYINKYVPIKCEVTLGDKCYIFNKDEMMIFMEKEMSIFILQRKLQCSTLNEKEVTTTYKNNSINLNEYVTKEFSHLFISYPKRTRIEYQTCKTYDIEEIEFNKLSNEMNKLELD